MICINDPENETVMVVSENGYGKRSAVADYRVTNRGGKGVKTLDITERTGPVIAIKAVTDDNDLMIINKSGIAIRMKLSEVRVQGRATQGVRLINLEKRNDVISSVCKVPTEEEEETMVEQEEAITGNNVVIAENEVTVEETQETVATETREGFGGLISDNWEEMETGFSTNNDEK